MARRPASSPRPTPAISPAPLPAQRHDDARPGRVGGGHVAFGAPGPAIDMDRVLQTWRDGTTVGGGMAGQDIAKPVLTTAEPALRETVALSDGTRIAFTVAGALLTVDDQG